MLQLAIKYSLLYSQKIVSYMPALRAFLGPVFRPGGGRRERLTGAVDPTPATRSIFTVLRVLKAGVFRLPAVFCSCWLFLGFLPWVYGLRLIEIEGRGLGAHPAAWCGHSGRRLGRRLGGAVGSWVSLVVGVG